jgi:phosphoglycerol transferase MdoB-like AlkP superfamily enzyme
MMNRLGRSLRELGPYTAIALVLPGGSLIALAAWSFRHRPLVAAHLSRWLVVLAAFGVALILPGNT